MTGSPAGGFPVGGSPAGGFPVGGSPAGDARVGGRSADGETADRFPAFADLVAGFGPSRSVFLTGAGISMDAPSCLPSGPALTERVCDAFLEPHVLAEIRELHAAFGWWQPPGCPLDRGRHRDGPARPAYLRLETLLGAAVRGCADTPVKPMEVLADVRDAVPNAGHDFFARHLAAGGRHITANFDGCVEQCHVQLTGEPPADGAVQHFHHSFLGNPDGAGLGATLASIQGGLDPVHAEQLLATLRERSLMVVAGYSGSDFFDVDTTVAAWLPGTLSGLRVVWIAHHTDPVHPWHEVPHEDASVPRLVRLLAAARAQVTVVCGHTARLYPVLRDRWDLGAPPATAPAAATAPARAPLSLSPDDPLRTVCTFVLARELGLHRRLRDMLADGSRPTAVSEVERWWARSESLWEQGRWRDLRRMWHRRTPGGPRGPLAAARAERIGASLWVQGRLLPAYAWLVLRRRRFPRGGAEYLMLSETAGRVVEHMTYTPELRLLGRRLARRHHADLRQLSRAVGASLFATRSDLRDSLRRIGTREPRGERATEGPAETVLEAGNLLAWVSYRHRRLRDTYQPPPATATDAELRAYDANLAVRYRELIAFYTLLGSVAGAARTVLLPGAERVFGPREYLARVRSVQYAPWHRFRLLSRYAVALARRRAVRLRPIVSRVRRRGRRGEPT